jgi:hypothetical protein
MSHIPVALEDQASWDSKSNTPSVNRIKQVSHTDVLQSNTSGSVVSPLHNPGLGCLAYASTSSLIAHGIIMPSPMPVGS